MKESDYLDLMYSLHISLIKDLQYLAEGFEHQQELKMSTIVTFPEAIRIYRELTSSKFKMN